MRTQADYDREDQIRALIVSRFGDWTEVSFDESDNIKQVIFDLSEENLGLHYGWVQCDNEDYVQDWGLEKSHEDARHTVCIRKWDEYDNQVFLHPNGSWQRERHYYTPKRAITLKNKNGGECLFWYQD